LQNKIAYGEVKNASGNWVSASIEGVTAAGATAKIPADFRVSITNAPGAKAYPISSFTYLLIPVQGSNAGNRKVLKDLLSWILKSGENQASGLSYAPLPESLLQKELAVVYNLK
jgi:phosphate transport system substrate-binding protein